MVEIIGFIIFLPIAIVGKTCQFGTDLPVCFWLSLANQLKLFISVLGNGWKAWNTIWKGCRKKKENNS